MKHISAPDSKTAATATAQLIIDHAANNPNAVLGLATGNTMRPVYKDVAALAKNGRVSFADIISFNLDEYLGLSADAPASFKRYMHDNLSRHIDMHPDNFHIPAANPKDAAAEAALYEAAITAAGGIGLQLLGLGTNGHIGFNEPGSARDSRTRVVELSEQTRRDNFSNSNDAPTHAISMGLATILSARKIVLLATGASKSEAVDKIIAGKEMPDWPCSYLAGHSDFTLVTDPAARGET